MITNTLKKEILDALSPYKGTDYVKRIALQVPTSEQTVRCVHNGHWNNDEVWMASLEVIKQLKSDEDAKRLRLRGLLRAI